MFSRSSWQAKRQSRAIEVLLVATLCKSEQSSSDRSYRSEDETDTKTAEPILSDVSADIFSVGGN